MRCFLGSRTRLVFPSGFSGMTPIRIGIIGDFNPDGEVHRATNESIQHSAHELCSLFVDVWKRLQVRDEF